MARADITAMLAENTSDRAERPAQRPAAAPTSTKATKAAPKVPATTQPTATPQDAAGSAGEVRQVFRKGAALFIDQSDALDLAARRLNMAKTTPGVPRITANTLLRIAADLLLARSSELSGDTEEQLRESLGLTNQHLASASES